GSAPAAARPARRRPARPQAASPMQQGRACASWSPRVILQPVFWHYVNHVLGIARAKARQRPRIGRISSTSILSIQFPKNEKFVLGTRVRTCWYAERLRSLVSPLPAALHGSASSVWLAANSRLISSKGRRFTDVAGDPSA